MQAPSTGFDLDGFIASAACICHPDRVELDWVAFAPGFSEEPTDGSFEFMPLGLLMFAESNEDCSFTGAAIGEWLRAEAEYTDIFVPFTAYPRPAGSSPLDVDWPYDGYRDVPCADGGTWSFDEATEVGGRTEPPWPWMFHSSPSQLGYRLKLDDGDVVLRPAALVSELEDEGDGPFVVSFYFLELDDAQLGSLRERLRSHVRRFIVE